MMRRGLMAITLLVLLGAVPARGENRDSADFEATIRNPCAAPLMIMRIDGRELRQFAFVDQYEQYGSPMWSHDGTKVAFDAWTADVMTPHVFVANADGSSLRDLTDGAAPSWAPGDERLAIQRYGENWGVWGLGSDGSGLEQLSKHYGFTPRWSPDGLQIVYSGPSQRGNLEAGLVVYNTLEGTERNLMADHELGNEYASVVRGFAWSPDGKRLALFAKRHDASFGLFLFTPGDLQERLKFRLSAKKTGLGVTWSPDGRELLVSMQTEADRDVQIYRVEVDSDAPPVRLPGLDANRSADDLAWSPDGQWVMFQSRAVP